MQHDKEGLQIDT